MNWIHKGRVPAMALFLAGILGPAHSQSVLSTRYLVEGVEVWNDQASASVDLSRNGVIESEVEFVTPLVVNGSYQIAPMEVAWRLANSTGDSHGWGEVDTEWFLDSEQSEIELISFDAQTGVTRVRVSVPNGGFAQDLHILPEMVFLQNSVQLALGWVDQLEIDEVTKEPSGVEVQFSASIPGDYQTPFVRCSGGLNGLVEGAVAEFSIQLLDVSTADREFTIDVTPPGAVLLPGQSLVNGQIATIQGAQIVEVDAGHSGAHFFVTPLHKGRFKLILSDSNGVVTSSEGLIARASSAHPIPINHSLEDAAYSSQPLPDYTSYDPDTKCVKDTVFGYDGIPGHYPAEFTNNCGPCMPTPSPNPVVCYGDGFAGGPHWTPTRTDWCQYCLFTSLCECSIVNAWKQAPAYKGSPEPEYCYPKTKNSGFWWWLLNGSHKKGSGQAGYTGGTTTTTVKYYKSCCVNVRQPGPYLSWIYPKCFE